MQLLLDLKRTVAREVQSCGLPDPFKGGFVSRNEGDVGLIQAALIAGLYPNVVRRNMGEVNWSTALNRKTKIHVSSVNSIRGGLSGKCQRAEEWLIYGECVKGPSR